MSLEERMAELTAALDRNTAALTGAAPAANVVPAALGGPATPKAPRTAKAAAAPVAVATPVVAPANPPAAARAATADTAAPVTPAQIKAAGDDLSTFAELDRAAAVALLGEFGVQKMTAMPSSSIPEFHNKVKAALARLQPQAAPSLV